MTEKENIKNGKEHVTELSESGEKSGPAKSTVNEPSPDPADKTRKGKISKHPGSQDAIHELQAKLDELNDKYLRLYSEFDNFRKRTHRERIELTKTAAAETIIHLLPVLDDFERALRVSELSDSAEAIKEGEKLIFSKLRSILEQKGLQEIKSIGEPFNTDLHDAITNIPAPTDDMKGKIIDQTEKGYLLNGKVIRYAKVVVGQ